MNPIVSTESFGYIVPELILGDFAIVLFFLSALTRIKAGWHSLLPWVAGSGLLLALAALLSGNLEGNLAIFDGLLVTDPMSTVFQAMVLVATLASVILSVGSPALSEHRRGEYYGLLMVLALGMCFLVSANNLLMIFVAMETVSLCSYLLVSWDDSRRRSAEAGLKYVLFGGVASAVMLFGMSLLYGLYGSLNLQGLHQAILSSAILENPAGRWAAWIAVAFTLTGFGFKIAAVPFHQWCPDAYEGAPTPFTALLSVAPKAAGFAVVLRFVWSLFGLDNLEAISVDIPWALLIGLLAALSMTVGNFVALVQNNLKRMLAYSSIAHAGYMLMGVVAGGTDGLGAVSIYMAIYVVMNMGAFAVVATVARATGSEDIDEYRGLGTRAPWLALVMVVFLVSLTGLPPTAGFVGKLVLFKALIVKGGTWFWVLALVGVFNSAVSLFYYARVFKSMYLKKALDDAKPVSSTSLSGWLATAFALPVLFFGIFFQQLLELAEWSARIFH
jgi:NADH-quinone oxidoreductase subunit N